MRGPSHPYYTYLCLALHIIVSEQVASCGMDWLSRPNFYIFFPTYIPGMIREACCTTLLYYSPVRLSLCLLGLDHGLEHILSIGYTDYGNAL